MICWYCGFNNRAEATNCDSCGHRLWKSIDAFFRMRKPLKVYYFSYGYSRHPREMSAKVQRLVHEIIEKREDILPFVPHYAFDALYDFPEGYSDKIPLCMHWEAEIIGRCDALVYSPEMKDSAGVKWEVAIAQKLGIPVYTYEEVREGIDLIFRKKYKAEFIDEQKSG